MQNTPDNGFADRQKTAAAARQALLSNFKPRQARPAAAPIDRAAERAAEMTRVREERATAKAEKQAAAAALAAAAIQAEADREAAELEAKRGKRKERKALSAAEAKAKRDAKYAARQARR